MMLEETNLSYIYDGSFEGLLTAIFDAYYRHENPERILMSLGEQSCFFEGVFYVTTSTEKSDRVYKSIMQKMGSDALLLIYNAYLSEMEESGKAILEFLKLGFKVGSKILDYLTHDWVNIVFKLAKATTNETHLLKGFMRFSKMENNVYYGEISPKYNCLPSLMSHFILRLGRTAFIINDLNRSVCGVCDGREWFCASSEGISLPKLSEDELSYQELWKKFYSTISIEDRINPRCRMSHMPKRFWGNMLEVRDELIKKI